MPQAISDTKKTPKKLTNIPLSILDLCPILIDGTPTNSFRNSLDLAQHAEKWGFARFWLAEHHSMPGIASSATSVVIGHIAGGTSSIRVGSGGIILRRSFRSPMQWWGSMWLRQTPMTKLCG
jgi:hypothetical protein